jgi:hypothetical protein
MVIKILSFILFFLHSSYFISHPPSQQLAQDHKSVSLIPFPPHTTSTPSLSSHPVNTPSPPGSLRWYAAQSLSVPACLRAGSSSCSSNGPHGRLHCHLELGRRRRASSPTGGSSSSVAAVEWGWRLQRWRRPPRLPPLWISPPNTDKSTY